MNHLIALQQLQARLPADVEQRMLAGTPYPEDEGALRAANMDFYANAAAAQRQQVIERARNNSRFGLNLPGQVIARQGLVGLLQEHVGVRHRLVGVGGR